MYKTLFSKYVHSINLEGSRKASSYVKALDWLAKMLEVNSFTFSDCKNIWAVNSINRLQELYELVLLEKRKGDSSDWNIDGIPRSYLQNGFCSAALKSYQEFLVGFNYEQKLLSIFDEHKGGEDEIIEKLDIELDYPEFLIEGLDKIQGKDVIRSVKMRVNQSVFRNRILKIYHQACCITGLDIPQVNRASHIIPWAEDSNKRLDLRNGLCLSATYDAAFDENLISLDEEYRIIVSNEIADHYTNDSVKSYFLKKEGKKITLPTSYLPRQDYLAVHRGKCIF